MRTGYGVVFGELRIMSHSGIAPFDLMGLSFSLATRANHAERDSALPRRLAVTLFEAMVPARPLGGASMALVAPLAVALGGSLAEEASVLRERVLRALGDGRVIALRSGRTALRTTSASETVLDAASIAPITPRETKTWVTIRLVDDADPPQPVARARYRIKLPDATVREGSLDGMGIAHFEGLDPGTCEVSFPDYDHDAWERM